MNYKFPKRENYGLCSLNFETQPYCNQMGGLFDKNIRFCDVCNNVWKNIDGKWVSKKELGDT